MRIAIGIAYDGSAFDGWQSQPSGNTGRDAGMIPLERSLAKLLDSGAVSANVVKKIASDHDLLASLSNKLR